MAILWQSSLVPFTDPNGNPYSGAKAFFFDATTTTPRVTFRNSGLDNPHDHPVIANASGMFPAVFLPTGDYRLRIEDATGVTIWDVDGISTPAVADLTPPDAGDTDATLLFRTGMIQGWYATGTQSGWVRANGRTIGSAISGATERANADCEALFLHLWTQDANLAVSGGRGASAAGDWAADKRIDLPNFRGRPVVGLDGMGAGRANVLTASDADTLGTRVGLETTTLTIEQIPVHNHPGTALQAGLHAHGIRTNNNETAGLLGVRAGNTAAVNVTQNTESEGDHTHVVTTENRGGGQAHSNLQPSLLATIYIKL